MNEFFVLILEMSLILLIYWDTKNNLAVELLTESNYEAAEGGVGSDGISSSRGLNCGVAVGVEEELLNCKGFVGIVGGEESVGVLTGVESSKASNLVG